MSLKIETPLFEKNKNACVLARLSNTALRCIEDCDTSTLQECASRFNYEIWYNNLQQGTMAEPGPMPNSEIEELKNQLDDLESQIRIKGEK